MIEISFGHKIVEGTLIIKKILIGHGLPTHGQLSIISFEKVYINRDGEIIFAELIWYFPKISKELKMSRKKLIKGGYINDNKSAS